MQIAIKYVGEVTMASLYLPLEDFMIA